MNNAKNRTLYNCFTLHIIIIFLTTFFHKSLSQTTQEIRAYIKDIDTTKAALLQLGAQFKSTYAFTDYIYQPKKAKWDLDKNFIRLRVYEKTNWKQKQCVIVHKTKQIQGYTGTIIMHEEFDDSVLAKKRLENEYNCIFSFYRTGWEFALNDNKIFIEIIDYIDPTIEVVAHEKNFIDYLFLNLAIDNVIGHSVPYIIQKKLET